jgi:hypothetical protein
MRESMVMNYKWTFDVEIILCSFIFTFTRSGHVRPAPRQMELLWNTYPYNILYMPSLMYGQCDIFIIPLFSSGFFVSRTVLSVDTPVCKRRERERERKKERKKERRSDR